MTDLCLLISPTRVRFEDITCPAKIEVCALNPPNLSLGFPIPVFEITPATLNRILRSSSIADLCRPLACQPDGMPGEMMAGIVVPLHSSLCRYGVDPGVPAVVDMAFTIMRTVQDVRLTFRGPKTDPATVPE